MPAKILHDLAVAIQHAGHDPDTIVIILRSAGEKAFCAGASFDELVEIKNEKEGLAFFSGFAHVINAMRLCPKFIIGRIHGKCVGGGVGLAAAVDYAIASEAAEVRLSELAIGIGPFVVGPGCSERRSIAEQLAKPGCHRRGNPLPTAKHGVKRHSGDAEQAGDLGPALAGRWDHDLSEEHAGRRGLDARVSLREASGHGDPPGRPRLRPHRQRRR